ncbi:glycoside hydrolase family 66 protein [Caloranaerobacter ferrireducens]|uniref:glycoside hydrolase family 66 protein n=1 Tax=Caloranaerobacter ferrireducens TaxID=1323370 RepID=UPI00084D3F7D|nr:glycoside hydrolase family 66 protein [Caloranaerobacter ferrireducens]
MKCKRLINYLLILILLASNISLTKPQLSNIAYATNSYVTKVYVDKARYNPSETATITVELSNSTESDWSGTLYLNIYHMETEVYSTSKNISIPAYSNSNESFTWITPSSDFKGYLVKVSTDSTDYKTTAIDVSSDWTRYPRYGYTSDFPTDETSTESTNKITELTRDYHINIFQFYDWMWRHDKNFKRTNGQVDDTWKDLFGRTISWETIQNQINAVHSQNAKAMAYQMSYAAREGYDAYNIKPKWGIYQDRNHSIQYNVDFGDDSTYLWLFNPANEEWQNYIINEYKDAVNTASFDGIQIDQMGQRDNVFDYFGRPLYLNDSFSDFVNEAKSQLTTNNSNKNYITFNVVDGTVDGWALNDISKNADTDFDFSEIWWKSNSYNDIKNYIEQFRTNNGSKALVLAAYMNYNDNTGTKYEAEYATLVNVGVNNNHSGYTGSGFVDQFAEENDSVEFTINVPEDGLYPLVFRYSNDTGNTATRNLYIDEETSPRTTLSFKDLENWDTWSHDVFYTTYLTVGTHTIKLQYDSENSGAINLDSLTLGEFDENSVRLANATFAASGAYHIELGANKYHATMLAHEYYPQISKTMRSSLRNTMMEYYDFITAYENLLFDSDINYGDGGTQFVSIENEEITGSGENGKIWFVIREKENYEILHLINLTNENDTQWRNPTNQPIFKNNINIKYYIGPNANITGVYVASPDFNQCVTQSLQYSIGSDSNGYYVSFTVPKLEYWDMIYIKRSFSTPNNEIYEAENALKTNVSTNTNHTGYSGTGFVDQFGEKGDSVSFSIKVDEDKDYTLKFRYANDTGYKATRALFVDGKFRGIVYFNDLENWDTWGIAEIGVHLKPGIHQIVLLYGEYENYAINLDYLKVEDKIEYARSLYISDWNDTIAIWKDSLTRIIDTRQKGPRIDELRYSLDWSTNQIVDYSGFFRDETNNVKYTQIQNFDAQGWFDSNGVCNTNYFRYNGNSLPVNIKRDYAMIPNEDFMVVRYNIQNPGTSSITFNILDALHVNNKTGSGTNISAYYDSERNSIIVNMTNAGQYFIGLSSFSSIDQYQVGDDTNTDISSSTCSPWYTFDNDGTLKNNTSITTSDISVAMRKSVTIPAQSSETIYFLLSISDTIENLESAIDKARSQTGEYWFNKIANDYTAWLNSGIRTNFEDEFLNTAYDRSLIAIKNAIQPTSGAMPATTNPSSYGYKVWARDSAVTAMALDASGHVEEAEKYWYWLANRQNEDGTFYTCFDIWTNEWIPFVEPEHDSIGMFLVGAYRHYKNTGNTEFLNNIWPAYKKSADFIMNNISSNGFGPADCSIWEENIEYNAFTQALYVAGLDAAQIMAKAKGLQDLADSYNGAASTIRSAIQRDSTDYTYKGLWNVSEKRFNRAVSTDNNEVTLHDSSSNVLISYGIIDAQSSRAKSHIDAIIEALGHDTYGIARYDNDGFYHNKPWDPGGDEALEEEPSWPQMAMWVAMYEIQSGNEAYKANALRRLKWFTERTAKGYMPQGEAVSNVTLKPAISTMVEPITGASYILTALAYLDNYDMKILPPQYNAGVHKSLNVSSATNGDWDQWWNVPYYKDAIGDILVNDVNYDIDRVYISNDDDNLYIRIDTVGTELPGFDESEKFAVHIYSEDFNGTASTSRSTAMYGAALSRDMNFMVGRWSDSFDFARFTAGASGWDWSENITSVIAPQWETTSGRIEIVIPFSKLSSSGSVSDGSWANLDIILVKQTDATLNIWNEVDSISIHYRKTNSNTQWLWGNVD